MRIRLDGADVLKRTLSRLPDKLQREALRRAMRKVGRQIARDAKAKAPRETGLLKRSYGFAVRTHRDKTGVYVIVGPRKGYRRAVAVGGKGRRRRLRAAKKGVTGTRYRNPTKYAHLAEKHQPHLKPAFEAGKRLATRFMLAEVREQLRVEAAAAMRTRRGG